MMLASSPLFAASFLITKALARRDSPTVIVAWQALTVTLFTLPVALYVWVWPTPWQWAIALVCGMMGSLGHWFLTHAYRLDGHLQHAARAVPGHDLGREPGLHLPLRNPLHLDAARRRGHLRLNQLDRPRRGAARKEPACMTAEIDDLEARAQLSHTPCGDGRISWRSWGTAP
jgi:hypothetical protein